MATYLDEILARSRQRTAEDTRSIDKLVEKIPAADDVNGSPRRFVETIRNTNGLSVIAEIKRRSPSKGDLQINLDPAKLSEQYAEGGATCLSVLTDEASFGGSVEDLQTARSSVPLPVLRKDFTVGAVDVVDARLMGADAILLIVAALDHHELRDFFDLASEIGLDCLIETHDEAEVERALNLEPSMIGVNQRDLKTFDVDTKRAQRLAQMLDESLVTVAESGVRGLKDAEVLAQAGYDAVLVGESLITSEDPAKAVHELREVETTV